MPLKPTSPFVCFLAGVWSTTLDLAVAGMAMAFAIDAWAPPQDLPWKPLRLADPPGMATDMKFAMTAADPVACRAVMRNGGVSFAEEPERSEGFCSTRDAVRLRSGAIALSPAAPIMTCREALAYAFWSRHAVQPAARSLLGEPVVRIEHYGTYACRNVYGRSQGRPSEHAAANALDVAAFHTASGRKLSVAADFSDRGTEGAFLRAARDGACRWFRAVLSPDYNAAHRDHFHLDFGRYRRCG